MLRLVQRVYGDFGLAYEVKLSTRPAEFLGEVETWDHAEAQLQAALERAGQPYALNAGDGAFYGPKIDFDVTDAIGRKWQCATIQLDYQLPQRFDLKYTGADNTEHRPVVIHRAIFGSFERFIAMLIEHYAGAFPLWLAPVQASCSRLPIGTLDYARQVERATGRGRPARRPRRAAGEDRLQDSRGAAAEGALHARGRRSRGGGGHGRGAAAAPAGTSARGRSRAFVAAAHEEIRTKGLGPAPAAAPDRG